MKMPSPSNQHTFARVPTVELERSTFDRSSLHKTTFDAGYLIPIWWDEALPGDTYNVNLNALARLATPIKPLMDNLYLDTFFFAVPYRLVWDNWQKFNGEQKNPGDSTNYILPQMTPHRPATGSLSDYFGLPVDGGLAAAGNVKHHSLLHRAYNLIYNEWFRDQNLIPSAVVDTDDGPDLITDYVLRRRGKRHDYFTSCLPFPQKGTAVSIPIAGGTAPVIPTGTATPTFNVGAVGPNYLETDPSQAVSFNGIPSALNPLTWASPELAADLSAVTATTINQLRQAFQIQRMLERDARGGTRYTEIILSHFKVTSDDARLQRPEYLGGGSAPIMISPIAQNAPSNIAPTLTPQGNLAGIGTANVSGSGFAKSFTEHCLLIGLASVRADLTYQQGLAREWSRQTRYDFYWPAFAHLGEQAVKQGEIWYRGDAGDDLTFGFQERYAEYRYKPSIITGKFRHAAPGTLEVWHLSQSFGTAPTLNQTFIEENPPMAQVQAVTSEPAILFDSYTHAIAARPLPTYSVPGLIDHF